MTYMFNNRFFRAPDDSIVYPKKTRESLLQYDASEWTEEDYNDYPE